MGTWPNTNKRERAQNGTFKTGTKGVPMTVKNYNHRIKKEDERKKKKARAKTHEQIESDVAAFLLAGGKITQLPPAGDSKNYGQHAHSTKLFD